MRKTKLQKELDYETSRTTSISYDNTVLIYFRHYTKKYIKVIKNDNIFLNNSPIVNISINVKKIKKDKFCFIPDNIKKLETTIDIVDFVNCCAYNGISSMQYLVKLLIEKEEEKHDNTRN
jgi:hypothetical protein